MFGTIRKHKTWLWGIIIAGTVVSFVVFFSPDAELSFGGGATRNYVSPTSGQEVRLFGEPISRAAFEKAYRETMLFYFIRSGKWPDTDEEAKRRIEADTLYRMLLVERAKDMEIHVSPQAVARTSKRRIGDYPYGRFVEEVLRPAGLNSADYERFVTHEATIQQLAAAVTAPALLVNPEEAEGLYRQEHQEVDTQLATFWATNFLDQVEVTPDKVQTFFTNRQAAYRIPPRVQVNYVQLPATNFLEAAEAQMARQTNLNAAIEEQYFRMGTNAFTDSNGVALAEGEAKAQLREDIREEFALVEARKEAAQFGTVLYELDEPNQPTNLLHVAAERGYEVHETPPFSYAEGLDDTNFPSQFRTTALKLTRSNPVHFLPIVGEEAVYVIALKTNLPSEMPPFEQVEEKVRRDFQQEQAMQLARAAGTNFYTFLTNGLAQGKTFDELAAEKNVTVLDVPPFSASTRSLTNVDERVNLRLLQQYALELDAGETTPFVRTPEGGVIAYVQGRPPVTEAQLAEGLPDFLSTMRNARFSDAFNGWLRKQVELAQLVVPQPEVVTSPPGQPQPPR